MLRAFVNAWKVKDLRYKILFTLFIIGIYRLGAHIPLPGVDIAQLHALERQASQSGGIYSLINLFSGKALTQMAVFALGIMPYITSSIIIQILTVVIPKLEQWQQEGQTGQKKITQWTRYLTVALALMQSTALVFVMKSGNGGLLGQSGFALPASSGTVCARRAAPAGTTR